MTYRYDEPIRAEDGVLFRVHDHARHAYLFKVTQQALEAITMAAPKPKNPLDPASRGYPSEQFQKLGAASNRLDHVDVYNQHRDAIHKAAVGLINAGKATAAAAEPCIITTQMLEAENTGTYMRSST